MLTLRTSCTPLLFAASVLLVLVALGQAQNYHYSNGWHPGKRSGNGNPLLDNDDKNCQMKLISLLVKNRIIMNEVERAYQACYFYQSRNNLQDFWQVIAQSPESSKLQEKAMKEEENKW